MIPDNPQPIMPLLKAFRKRKVQPSLDGLRGTAWMIKHESRKVVIDDLILAYFHGRQTCDQVADQARDRIMAAPSASSTT